MATLQTEMSAPTTTTTTPNTSPQTSAPSTPRITSSLLSPNTSPSSSPFSSSPSTPKMPPSEPSLPKDPKPKPQTYEQMMAEINAATALEGYDAKGLYHSTASNAPILIKEAAPVVFKQRYGEDRLVYAGVGRLGDWDDEEGDGDEAGESLKKKEGKGKGGVVKLKKGEGLVEVPRGRDLKRRIRRDMAWRRRSGGGEGWRVLGLGKGRKEGGEVGDEMEGFGDRVEGVFGEVRMRKVVSEKQENSA